MKFLFIFISTIFTFILTQYNSSYEQIRSHVMQYAHELQKEMNTTSKKERTHKQLLFNVFDLYKECVHDMRNNVNDSYVNVCNRKFNSDKDNEYKQYCKYYYCRVCCAHYMFVYQEIIKDNKEFSLRIGLNEEKGKEVIEREIKRNNIEKCWKSCANAYI